MRNPCEGLMNRVGDQWKWAWLRRHPSLTLESGRRILLLKHCTSIYIYTYDTIINDNDDNNNNNNIRCIDRKKCTGVPHSDIEHTRPIWIYIYIYKCTNSRSDIYISICFQVLAVTQYGCTTKRYDIIMYTILSLGVRGRVRQ